MANTKRISKHILRRATSNRNKSTTHLPRKVSITQTTTSSQGKRVGMWRESKYPCFRRTHPCQMEDKRTCPILSSRLIMFRTGASSMNWVQRLLGREGQRLWVYYPDHHSLWIGWLRLLTILTMDSQARSHPVITHVSSVPSFSSHLEISLAIKPKRISNVGLKFRRSISHLGITQVVPVTLSGSKAGFKINAGLGRVGMWYVQGRHVEPS